MSQLLTTFGINWQLLLAQAINFGLLLLLLWYFLYRPVLRILDERRRKIADGVRTAELADKKLQDAAAEGQGIVSGAAREAEGILAEARARAEERGSEITRSAEARAQAALMDAQARADEAKRQALKESEREIARAAMLAAEKILREKSA